MTTATADAITTPGPHRAPRAPGVQGAGIPREMALIRRDPLASMDHLAQTYGDVARLTFPGGASTYFLRGAEQVRHVLVTRQANYPKSPHYALLHRILGMGLLTADGEPWQRRRALIQPMFAKRHLAPFAEYMAAATTTALDGWEHRWADGHRIDLATELSALTLDVVGRALMGRAFAGEGGRVGEPLGRFLAASGAMGRSPLVQLAGTLHALPMPWAMASQPARLRQANRAVDALDTVVFEMIDRRRGGDAGGDDLLGLLLDARHPETGEPLTREELRDELMTFLLAGHETTANGLVFMFALLSQHPAAREALLAEVDEVLGGRVPTAGDAERLPWTTACFQEAMRLFPPVWHVSRTAREDDVVGGHHVGAGSLVMVSTWTTHRDPAVWDNPAGFDPRRFLGDAPKERPRHAYFPFGGGRRVCIGQGFAMLEAAVLAAMIAQRFTFDLVPGHPIVPEPTATLRPKHGIAVTVRRRPAA